MSTFDEGQKRYAWEKSGGKRKDTAHDVALGELP